MFDFLLATLAVTVAMDRYYYIMADEIVWDYAPSYPYNPLTGEDFDADALVFLSPEDYIGREYVKALYVEYTDSTFTTVKERPASEEHLGFLGPVIRAEVGDTIYVTFMNNGSFPYTMHAHGVSYDKSSEGSAYKDNTSGADLLDVVKPGEKYTYTWFATEESGPIEGSGMSSMGWWYHSHNEPISEMAGGLMGPIVICARGMCDANGKPTDVDQEIFTVFMVMDENASILNEINLNRYMDGITPNDDEMDDFEESNLMHAMNGYLYGNLGYAPKIEITKGSLVRWYLLAVGNEVDLHTAHWHGNTVVSADGVRSDVEQLLPGSLVTVDMIPEKVGTWLWHCHVADHIGAGMLGYYTVVDCGDNCYTGNNIRTFPRLGAAGFVIESEDDHTSVDETTKMIACAALIVAVIALIGFLALCIYVCSSKTSDDKKLKVKVQELV